MATCNTCGSAMLTERPHRHAPRTDARAGIAALLHPWTCGDNPKHDGLTRRWYACVRAAEQVAAHEVRDAIPAPDEVERLRQQNHDAAVAADRRMAALQSKVDRYENAYKRAKELVRGSPVDWTHDDPGADAENMWWNYTSPNNRSIIAAAVRDAIPAESLDVRPRHAPWLAYCCKAHMGIAAIPAEHRESQSTPGVCGECGEEWPHGDAITAKPLDVERLAVALRVIDQRIAAVAAEQDVDNLLGPDAETGRRDYAVQIAREYAALPDTILPGEPEGEGAS